jgi:uroporphyrin-III C-methyltransferase/precorrin-2 dehydrogenase/sirohydrochlorin ferrochelatase
MGLVSLADICSNLKAQGMRADMPAAVISRGTMSDQQVIIGNLSSLPNLVSEREVAAPSLVIIGTVVTLHPRYHWFAGESL